MRFAYVSSNYASYLASLYAAHPVLALEPFAAQEQALYRHCFGWNGCWIEPMQTLGYEARDFYLDNPLLDQAWRREHGGTSTPADSSAIALQRIQEFAPDVVFFDHGDLELLRAIRQLPATSLVIGWEGGGLSRQACWPHLDLLLSCAPESVITIRAAGMPAEQMHHAFNPAVLERIGRPERHNRIAFFGQLVRGGDFHMRREMNLVQICAAGLPFDLYSPSYSFTPGQMSLARLKMVLRILYRTAARVPGLRPRLARLPYGELARPEEPFPRLPVNPRLRANLRPARFGLDMYSSIAQSSVCLNIHADNTPDYASNMRLFETTGVATCLLTDRRRNIGELFEPDKEIVVYENLDDCIEKMRWLTDHPEKAREIGAAGQARTLRDHTFAQRAGQLHEHIQRLMREKSVRL